MSLIKGASFRLVVFLCTALWVHAAQSQSGTETSRPDQANTNTLKILFVGNSHLLVKNVPAQVRSNLLAKYQSVQTDTLAVGGAKLSDFVGRSDVVAAISKLNWDVVVLQEASVSFLSAKGRRRFHRSVEWFVRRLQNETRIILYQTWPWRTGSRYYGRRAFNQESMWSAMRHEYSKVARQPRIVIAPVGTCWVRSPHKLSFYSDDGNHASVRGARFAASVIAKTIAAGRRSEC